MAEPQRQWAVVTGASSGLGVALAAALARRGSNLVLVARREAPMRELAAKLQHDHGVETIVEAMDLSEPGSAVALQQRLDAQGIEVGILVNNAAFGLSGAFIDQDPARLRAMLQLDIVTVTELTHGFAQRMAARGGGRILLVASIAAYQPTPALAAYGAAKAYVLSLGESLNVELAPKVAVTVLAPGLMDTEFHAVAGFKPTGPLMRTILAPADVAAIGLDAMFAGRPSVTAGRLNKVIVLGGRLLPRSVSAKMAHRISRT